MGEVLMPFLINGQVEKNAYIVIRINVTSINVNKQSMCAKITVLSIAYIFMCALNHDRTFKSFHDRKSLYSKSQLSLFVLSFSFSFPFLSFFVSLSCHCCCGLLGASSIAESSQCFWNCSRNSVRRLVPVISVYHRELMKLVGKLW